MLFGRDDSDASRFKFNVAVFPRFSSAKTRSGRSPRDLDYFYGHYRDASDFSARFRGLKLQADLCDEGAESCFENKSDQTNESEQLVFRAAFVNRGVGRAPPK